MNLIADMHSHTIASGHAVSTMGEMITQAKQMGYKALAITDHTPMIPGAMDWIYFINFLRQPDLDTDGFLMLKGLEADILDKEGTIEIPNRFLPQIDWLIVSIHDILLRDELSYESTTEMWQKVAKNPHVDMIGHSEMAEFLYDYDLVTKVFSENNKVVELNAGSSIARPGNEGNLKKLALACMKNGTKVAVNSDAHSIYQLDGVNDVLSMLDEINFPQELVINSSMERLWQELVIHKKDIVNRIKPPF